MGNPISIGLKRISDTVKGFYVRSNAGTELATFDTDGYVYQNGTKITATAAQLNGTAPAITGGTISDAAITNTTYASKTYTNDHPDWTLSAAENKYPVLQVGGTADGSCNVIVSTANRIFVAINSGTGQNIVVKTAGGTGPTVATAKSALLWCNGTNVVRITADC